MHPENDLQANYKFSDKGSWKFGDQQTCTNENFTEYNPGKKKMFLESKQKIVMIILSTWIPEQDKPWIYTKDKYFCKENNEHYR